MNCRRFEKWIALAAGGDLGPRKARRLEEHLASCEACRGFARDMAAARAEFVSSAEVEPADYGAIRAGVMARIAEERRRPAALWWWGAAAVATAALLLAVLWPRGAVAPPPAMPKLKPPEVVRHVEPPAPERPESVAARRARRAPRTEVIRPPQDDPERPAVVKIETQDPRVVVYWVMENAGDE